MKHTNNFIGLCFLSILLAVIVGFFLSQKCFYGPANHILEKPISANKAMPLELGEPYTRRKTKFIYEVEDGLHGNSRSYHVRYKLPSFTSISFLFADENEKSAASLFKRRITSTRGVLSAYSRDYKLEVSKAKLFSWQELEPKILDVLKDFEPLNYDEMEVFIDGKWRNYDQTP